MARWLSWLERRPVTAEVVGSNPIRVVIEVYAEASTSTQNSYAVLFARMKLQSKFYYWDLSSAGRASALQAEGHRFEPYRSHYMPAWRNWQTHRT